MVDLHGGNLMKFRHAVPALLLSFLVSTSFAGNPEDLIFSRVRVSCEQPDDWRAVAGRKHNGQSGYVHRVACNTSLRSDGVRRYDDHQGFIYAELGWSPGPERPVFISATVVRLCISLNTIGYSHLIPEFEYICSVRR